VHHVGFSILIYYDVQITKHLVKYYSGEFVNHSEERRP
jgi:hypothetical protein